jgi:hypothetical protein
VRVARVVAVEKIPAAECRQKDAESLIGSWLRPGKWLGELGGNLARGREECVVWCSVVWVNEASGSLKEQGQGLENVEEF